MKENVSATAIRGRKQLTQTSLVHWVLQYPPLLGSVLRVAKITFLFPYSLGEKVINSTVDSNAEGRTIGRLRCSAPVGSRVLHALLWWFLALITFGIAGFFYLYGVGRTLANSTSMELRD